MQSGVAMVTNEEIHSFAVATVNEKDSATGRIIHIAAFETGAKWMRSKSNEWISLEDQRPKIAEKVLTLCTKGSYWIGFRAIGGWYINTNQGQLYLLNDDRNKPVEIAYWLPIPKPPKEIFDKLFPENERRKKEIDVDINYDLHEGRGEDNELL